MIEIEKINETYDWFIKPNSKNLVSNYKVSDDKHYEQGELF